MITYTGRLVDPDVAKLPAVFPGEDDDDTCDTSAPGPDEVVLEDVPDVGLDVGLGVGDLEVGVDDVGVDVGGADVGLDVELDVELDVGLEVGLEVELGVVELDVGLEVGLEIELEVGLDELGPDELGADELGPEELGPGVDPDEIGGEEAAEDWKVDPDVDCPVGISEDGLWTLLLVLTVAEDPEEDPAEEGGEVREGEGVELLLTNHA